MKIDRTQPFDAHAVKRTQEQEGAHRVQPVTPSELPKTTDVTQGNVAQLLTESQANSQPATNTGSSVELAFSIAALKLSLINPAKPYNPNNPYR